MPPFNYGYFGWGVPFFFYPSLASGYNQGEDLQEDPQQTGPTKKTPQIEGLSKKIINERDVEGELHIEYFCQPTTPIKCCCDILYILDFCILIWICSESKASMVQ